MSSPQPTGQYARFFHGSVGYGSIGVRSPCRKSCRNAQTNKNIKNSLNRWPLLVINQASVDREMFIQPNIRGVQTLTTWENINFPFKADGTWLLISCCCCCSTLCCFVVCSSKSVKSAKVSEAQHKVKKKAKNSCLCWNGRSGLKIFGDFVMSVADVCNVVFRVYFMFFVLRVFPLLVHLNNQLVSQQVIK